MSAMFKIFVGNINAAITEDVLRKLFEPHIPIDQIVIPMDHNTNHPLGYAFVLTKDRMKGRAVLRRLGNSLDIDGRTIFMTEATGKKEKKDSRPRPSQRPKRSRRPNSRINTNANADLTPRITDAGRLKPVKPQTTNSSGYEGEPGNTHQPETPKPDVNGNTID
ncbi:MAG: hypothetical protein ACYTGQ_19285 [Planctomycetota bacterium]|jgi:RNA recognition motif-containing protein